MGFAQGGGLFDQLDAESNAVNANTQYLLYLVFKVLNMIRIIGVSRAGGDNKFTLPLDTVVMWGFGIPIYIVGIFWSYFVCLSLCPMYLEDAPKFVPVIKRVVSRKWMNNLTQ
ncbi:MAG: hypothetical protein IPK77_10440 [Cellvibrio sp.]|nr:hypothetical protein [Cellvibrio sp.]